MISKILGNVASGGLGGLFSLVDDLFTSKEEAEAAKLKIMQLQQSGRLAQMGVNAEEAKHKSIFVAGWRPFVGWVCGTALAWSFLVRPFLEFVLAACSVDLPGLPSLDPMQLMPILIGMMGIGGMRSYDKIKGVSTNKL